MTRAELIQYITDNVYPNARNEVTAPMVRDSLLEIVDFLGDAATYNIGMVASGNQGLVTGGNVNTAIALALLPYYTAAETGQAIDDAIARLGLGQAAFKDLGQVADGNTGLVTGGQVYSAINAAITSAIKFQGVSDTPLTDGSTTNPIQIDGQSYTAKKGDMVVYGGNEYLWVGNKWQQMGDESSYALKTIQITGTGYLTGGGDLTQNRTLDISATAKGYIDHGETAYGYFTNGVLDTAHLPSMYIGTTSVQFTAAAQNLTGVSSVRATNDISTLFEWDSTNSAWHFHGNIYTDGWFSGGGISPGGGGGGGGIDPVAMWRLLTNNPSLTQYDNYTKISADHINFPVTSVVGLTGAITKQQIAQALELGSLAYKSSLTVSDIPDLSGTYLQKAGGTMTGHISWGEFYKNEANGWAFTEGLAILSSVNRSDTGSFANYSTALSVQGRYGFQIGATNNISDIRFRINGTNSTWYKFWNEGNSNKSDVRWFASDFRGHYLEDSGVMGMGTASSFVGGGETGAMVYVYGNNPFKIWTNGYARVTVNGGGNVGIKTGAPAYDFDVVGTICGGGVGLWEGIKIRRSNDGAVAYTIGSVDETSTVMKILNVSGYSSFITLDYAQHVGIMTNSPSYTLDVEGVIHASTGIYTDGWFSGGGVASSSDRRLKKNIKNFAYTPNLLLAIRPREWDWKDGSAMVGHAAGFVAQEIEPIMPYAVDGTRNYKALFYDRFHALEIAGLQDHERRIVELERAVKERDEKIEMLEKMLKLN